MSQRQLNFLNASVPYVTKNNLPTKKPVFFVKFGLVTGPLGTNSQILPNQYASGPIMNPTSANRPKLLLVPSSYSNQIDPITCHTTFSQKQFTLQDKGGVISQMISTYTIKNRLVTIGAGYTDINESDFTLYSGQIQNVEKTQDGTGWIFTVVGALTNLNNNILAGHTTLAQDFTNGQTNMFVVQIANFARMTDQADGQGARNYIKVDNSIYSYQGVGTDILDGGAVWQWQSSTPSYSVPGPSQPITTWAASTSYLVGNQITYLGNNYQCVQAGTSSSGTGPVGQGVPMFWGLQLVQPGGYGALTDQNHSAGSSVDNFVLYQGNPVTLMLQIMLSTGFGTNYSGTGVNYDVLPKSQGIGIPYNLVNVANIAAQGQTYVGSAFFLGYGTDITQCIKFFETEFLQQICGWLFENVNGQADLAMFYVPFGQITAVTLDDTLIVGQPQFDANLATGNDFQNEVQYYYDGVPGPGGSTSGTYLNFLDTKQSDSQVQYEEASPLIIYSNFMRTIFGAAQLAQRSSAIFIALFQNPPPVIQLRLLYSANLINIGDPCYIASKYLPDYKTGVQDNIPQLCTCVDLQPDFFNGYVQASFLGFGYNTTARYAAFAPDSVPVFGSATPAQIAAYAFFCGTSNTMPDGSPAYVFAP